VFNISPDRRVFVSSYQGWVGPWPGLEKPILVERYLL
jgi:hypothetical protein